MNYTLKDYPIGSYAYNHNMSLKRIKSYEKSSKGEDMIRFEGGSRSFMRNCKPKDYLQQEKQIENWNFY